MPVLAAVVAIPILVHRLGADRFGVLTISWAIAGYFGLFDFGLGRALTKAMAQELSLGRDARAAELFWTALAMMLAFGVVSWRRAASSSLHGSRAVRSRFHSRCKAKLLLAST